jgi:hypothetical protein
MGMPGAPDAPAELQGPGKPEFVAVDDSIVFVLKPHELERKKRKFKTVRAAVLSNTGTV